MSKRRVVITGLGVLTPVGLTVSETWNNLLAGKSGIDYLTKFDTDPFSVKFGGVLKGFHATDYIAAKEAKKMDPFIHYGIAAGTQALQDSGLEVTDENAFRIGVSIGSGIGGIGSIETQHSVYQKSGPRRISPFFVPSAIINMISGNLSIMHGLKGPNMAIGTACATGTHSIGDSARMIQYGDADVMIAGGAEYATTELGLGGFAAARALSTRNDDPQAASRPWDKGRLA
ncbi:MAG: beta-ketoacyl synthase N-terminal-like domain-containing protein, partial [Pseudomonadota bacterium]|nr:beta-ketoacyl synthase N-terminal-like domain-containing protein [Pseudomonadota bacterium]